MAKTVLQRITINNILAFLIVGTYCAIWAFTLFHGITEAQAEGTSPLIGVITALGDLAPVIGTMTIIVVLVVQFYFRTAPTPEDES